eukprot:TRINITY_DN7824_c1_g1_i3.p1 TRINITY_DN7824_c1_g1~~TRINITY_DN7824_c1_g1_i3.p1  ORF type:complete len:337 (-),score=34.71 TRINITY_DN7824_c1_g1_i3:76-1086(-)
MSLVPVPFWGFLVNQWIPLPLYWRDLKGKTVVITGSNVGLGLDAAKHLSTMHPSKLILAVRDVKKGNEAVAEIQAHSGYEGTEVWSLDLADFASVEAFANRFKASGERLDILISNAGVNTRQWSNTKDGFESTLQVNHLSNMLLVSLLLPVMQDTAKTHNVQPRIVIVASEVHAWTSYDQRSARDPISALNDPSRSSIKDRYPVSKLLNVFMTRQFATRMKAKFPDVSIHCLNPGFCKTALSREFTGLIGIGFGVFALLFARTSEQGARTLVHAAVHEDLDLERGPGGRYWSECSENAPTLTACSSDLAVRVWEESASILVRAVPRSRQTLDALTL